MPDDIAHPTVDGGDAQHTDQLRVRYDDCDSLWPHFTYLSDAATVNDASNVIDFIATLASAQAPPPADIPHLRINGEESIPTNYLECLALPDLARLGDGGEQGDEGLDR